MMQASTTNSGSYNVGPIDTECLPLNSSPTGSVDENKSAITHTSKALTSCAPALVENAVAAAVMFPE